MVEQGNRKTFSAFSSLRRFAQEESEKAAEVVQEQAAQERCELCSEPIPPEHRHLLEVSTREIMCACRACSILSIAKRRAKADTGSYPTVACSWRTSR
jgi:DNA repair exonuclease SbcCD ATPase subunit